MAIKHIKQKHLTVFIIISAAVAIAFLLQQESTAPAPDPASSPQIEVIKQDEGFNKKQFSIDEPGSLWVVVNKKRPISSSYSPTDMVTVNGEGLRSEAANQLNRLVNDAADQNVPLKSISGFRGYSEQKALYESYVMKDGQAAADTYSARPSFSEHQTGWTMDMGNKNGACDLEICFEQTLGGMWLAENAHKYGFIVRYLQSKTDVTGYQYEPWHLRYVGTDLATELFNSKQTMEEFFGLPAAPSY